MKTTLGEHLTEGTEQHSFGFKDAKGREIGAELLQGLSVYVPVDADVRHGNDVKPGTYLTAYIHVTRAEERFGASGRFKLFHIDASDKAELAASTARSAWVAEQLADLKTKQQRNAA